MKMKSIFVSMLAIAALTSCSKENTTGGAGAPIPEGETTYATFSFKVNGAVSTYAGMTEEYAKEDDVADVLMLIFDATNGKAGKLITKAEGTTNAPLTAKTTSGSKRIYVMTNVKNKTEIQAKIALLVEETSTLADFYAMYTDGELAGGGGADMGAGFYELIANGEMVMSNVADRSAVYTLHPGVSADDSKNPPVNKEEENNNFSFNVLRTVAKGNLKVVLKDADSKTTDKIFELKSAVDFVIRNINRSVYFVQQYASDELASSNQDHGKDNAIRPWSPFYNRFDNLAAPALEDLTTYAPFFFSGYDFGNTVTIQSATPSKSVYFSPNSMNKALRGNTTYYGIRTQVSKIGMDDIAATITFDGLGKILTTAAAADYDNTAGTEDFYFAREIPADMVGMFPAGEKIRKVFTSADVAFQAMAIIIQHSPSVNLESTHFTKTNNAWTAADLKEAYDNDQSANALTAKDKAIVDRYIGFYTDGFSYYRLNIYELTDANNKRHLVRRNHAYSTTVTSFGTLGVPTPDDLDKDPQIPVDADATHVTATIVVTPWHNVDISEDL